MKRHRHGYTKGTALCKRCNETVDVKWEDVGIGAYEFWGCRGTDVRMIAFCPQCEEQIDESTIDYEDIEPEYNEDDWRQDR